MHLVDCFVDVFTYVRQLTARDDDELSGSLIREQLDELFAQKAYQAIEAGYQQRHYDDAKFAVVAWVDEQILTSTLAVKESWRVELLQKHYFNTVHGGQIFFEKLIKLDQFDAFDMDVREVFFYCLAFGFHGKYYTDAAVQELATIRKDNYQLLMQSQGTTDPSKLWFDQEPLHNTDHSQKFIARGWSMLFGMPLIVFVSLVAWFRIDLLKMVEDLIKSL